jgi:predicted nucleic acid-binding protein
MNVYVETNFVLELALLQEQHQSCEAILRLCESGKANLILPAYCLVEPYETLIRRQRERKRLGTSLGNEITLLARTSCYTRQIDVSREVVGFLVRSSDDEISRMTNVRTKFLEIAEIISLDHAVLEVAAQHQLNYDLLPQDAIVFSSVLAHLSQYNPGRSCFLNKNSKDFDDPDIRQELEQYNCTMLPRFDNGYQFLVSQLHCSQ